MYKYIFLFKRTKIIKKNNFLNIVYIKMSSCNLMNDYIKQLEKIGIISFGINISQTLHKSGVWKKDVSFPSWKFLTKPKYNDWVKKDLTPLLPRGHKDKKFEWRKVNGLAIKTGKCSGLFVVDIDNISHWLKLLEEEGQEEPQTVKAISGSGGIHLYFKYTDELEKIKFKTNAKSFGNDCDGKKYDLDIRTDGGCIICPPSKFFNKNIDEESKYRWKKSIFEHELLEVPQWIQNILLKNMKDDSNEKLPKNLKVKPTDLLQSELKKENIKLTGNQIEELVKMVDVDRANNYTKWIEMCFCLKCENTNDNLKYFDMFSKRGEDYNANSVKSYWYKYNANTAGNKLSYNSLLYWAKNDNPSEYNKFKKKHFKYLSIKDEKDIEINDTIEINQEYLLPQKKLGDCKVSHYINDFIYNDNIKSLLIRSPYNTGKTTMLKSICDNYDRILFISYRITLSSNLYGNFKDLGLELYTEHIYADKLICQVDSLHKITNTKYDLVIIDESESVFNHFSAGSLKNNYDTFQIFCALCVNANKIICLDGDLHNRTKRIIKSFGECKYIKNTIKKDIRHFIFTPNQEEFSDDIEKKIMEGKNICIVSMSEQQAEVYYNKYKKKYRVIKYTSKTSDRKKKNLEKVEEIWINYQIVIYSPSIEAGVDFNKEHFDNIFIVMCANSTSPRGLNQMINRIRQLRNPNILCFTHMLTITENLKFHYYTFEEIKMFYDKLIEKKVEFILDEHNVLVPNNKEHYDLYDVLMIYNKQEILNKSINCFIPNFLSMIKQKGHTYEINTEAKRKIEDNKNIVRANIIDAKNIDEEKYNILKSKEAKQDLNETEKFELTKKIYQNIFNLPFDTKEEIDRYYNRFNVINNCSCLLDLTKLKFNETEMKNKEKYTKYIVVQKILNLINVNLYELKNNEIIISQQDLYSKKEELEKILQDNKVFFNLGKHFKFTSDRKITETIRTLLFNYGIELVIKSKTERNKKNKVVKLPPSYIFNFDQDVINKINLIDDKIKEKIKKCEGCE